MYTILWPERGVLSRNLEKLKTFRLDLRKMYPEQRIEIFEVKQITNTIKPVEEVDRPGLAMNLGEALKSLNKYKAMIIDVLPPDNDSEIGSFKVTLSDGETNATGGGVYLNDAIYMAEQRLKTEKIVPLKLDASEINLTVIEPKKISASGIKI